MSRAELLIKTERMTHARRGDGERCLVWFKGELRVVMT